MYRFTQDAIDLDELGARLCRMCEADPIAFGKAAQNMCSPAANLGQPPQVPFVIQLWEARKLTRRRTMNEAAQAGLYTKAAILHVNIGGR
jgi:hypothetical protein